MSLNVGEESGGPGIVPARYCELDWTSVGAFTETREAVEGRPGPVGVLGMRCWSSEGSVGWTSLLMGRGTVEQTTESSN